jgi:hypothetical protein
MKIAITFRRDKLNLKEFKRLFNLEIAGCVSEKWACNLINRIIDIKLRAPYYTHRPNLSIK